MVVTGGHQTAQRCSVIPIQQAPDTNGPIVQFASPANGAVAQAVSSRIGMIMSDHIDVASLTTNSFTVRPVGGSAVPGYILDTVRHDQLLPEHLSCSEHHV